MKWKRKSKDQILGDQNEISQFKKFVIGFHVLDQRLSFLTLLLFVVLPCDTIVGKTKFPFLVRYHFGSAWNPKDLSGINIPTKSF
jgi:hypothetical protein